MTFSASRIRWAVVGALSVLVLVVAVTGWIYYSNSIEEAPTCLSFRVSGTVDARAKVLVALPDVVESAGMVLKAEHGASKVWQSDKATVTVYSDENSGEYSVFVCQKQRTERLWQDVARRIEQLLQGSPATAWLQRNNRDFQCDPNCTAPVSMPIDFEHLNRTMLVRGPSS